MMSILGAEWASNAFGNGSGSLQIDNYVRKPEELNSTEVKELWPVSGGGSSPQVNGIQGWYSVHEVML